MGFKQTTRVLPLISLASCLVWQTLAVLHSLRCDSDTSCVTSLPEWPDFSAFENSPLEVNVQIAAWLNEDSLLARPARKPDYTRSTGPSSVFDFFTYIPPSILRNAEHSCCSSNHTAAKMSNLTAPHKGGGNHSKRKKHNKSYAHERDDKLAGESTFHDYGALPSRSKVPTQDGTSHDGNSTLSAIKYKIKAALPITKEEMAKLSVPSRPARSKPSRSFRSRVHHLQPVITSS